MVSIEDLHAGWMVLNNLLGELKESGVFIPDLTFEDLRNSKITIEYLRSFEDDIKIQENAETHLKHETEVKILSLRETMMVWGEEKHGVDFRKQWEQKFHDALHGKAEVLETDSEVSISDIPREKGIKFFRIKLPDGIPVEVISEVAEHCEVLITLDGEHHLQVSGKEECVQDAMKKLGEIFYGESKLA